MSATRRFRLRPTRRSFARSLTQVVCGGIAWTAVGRPQAIEGQSPRPETSARDHSAPDSQIQRGRWGEIVVRPIAISPPLEYIPTDAGPVFVPRWFLPQASRDDVRQALGVVGFPDDVARPLADAASPAAGTPGFWLQPSREFVRSLDTTIRARLYRQLAKFPANFSQQAAYRYFGSSVDDWLGTAVAPRIRQLVNPLIYRDGDFFFFADLELVREEIGQGPELQRLVKRLLRQATVLVDLRLEPGSRLELTAEYWGRGGRKTDIRPLLESVAAAGGVNSIDIVHLLPELPRRLLYRYPRVSLADLRKPQLANCFWTALNFFQASPDDAFLDPKLAFEELRSGYYLIQDELQLGDIVALSDRHGNIFHVAVHLAGDLVFTKNGYFSLAPWTILPLARLQGHFAEHRDDWHVTHYRRADL